MRGHRQFVVVCDTDEERGLVGEGLTHGGARIPGSLCRPAPVATVDIPLSPVAAFSTRLELPLI